MQISIVVPLYNEDESLPDLVAWIDRVMKEHEFSYEVVMIDDGSNDRSWEVIEELRQKYPAIRGIRFQRNYGKSAALHVGFQAVKGDVVITMDADMQDSPDEIPELYRMIVEEGFDLVSGWKKKRFDPLSKTIPTKLYNWAARMVSGIKLHDFNCGLKAYRKQVVKSVEIYGEMHRYVPILAKWAGFDKIGEKVVQHRARQFGVTKFGLSRFINGPLDLVSIFITQKYLKRPMHFFGLWGGIFMAIGGISLLRLATLRLIWDIWISEKLPAMIFSATLLLMGAILISTGLLAELVGRSASSRNDYKISERTDDNKQTVS